MLPTVTTGRILTREIVMKRAVVACLLVFLASGLAVADEPSRTKKRAKKNRQPVVKPAEEPRATVPASRATRAEWQRRLEQRRLEMQRRGLAPRGRGPARAEVDSPRSSKRKSDPRNDAPKKRGSKKRGSKNEQDAKKRKPKGKAGKPDGKAAKKADESNDLPIIVPRAVRVPSYAAVRATIPFSRSEWEADPTYRHNGTMELMLGQLRDMVVYRYPPMSGPGGGSGVTINNGGGNQYPPFFNGFGFPFGFNPGLNGAIQSRAIINGLQTQGFIGRGAPILP